MKVVLGDLDSASLLEEEVGKADIVVRKSVGCFAVKGSEHFIRLTLIQMLPVPSILKV